MVYRKLLNIVRKHNKRKMCSNELRYLVLELNYKHRELLKESFYIFSANTRDNVVELTDLSNKSVIYGNGERNEK